jgi:hypothetical protein
MLSNTCHGKAYQPNYVVIPFARSTYNIRHHPLLSSSRSCPQILNHILATLNQHRQHIKKSSSIHRAGSLPKSPNHSSHNASSQTQTSVQELVLMFSIIHIKSSMFIKAVFVSRAPKARQEHPTCKEDKHV